MPFQYLLYSAFFARYIFNRRKISALFADTPSILRELEVPYRQHYLYTKDHYQLSIFQLFPQKPNHKTILLQHGLAGSSDSFIVNLQKSIAFLLLQQGYQVWLGNNRGNIYSNSHFQLNQTQKQYWNFSFTEMATYDLTAQLKYISTNQNTQNQKQIVYIGLSLGTTQILYLLSKNDQIKKVIKKIVLLAPVAKLQNTSYFRKIISILPIDKILFFTNGSILNRNKYLTRSVFQLYSMFKDVFYVINKTILRRNYNLQTLGIVLGHAPSGTSLKTVKHCLQIIRKNKFQQYQKGEQQVEQIKLQNLNNPPIMIVYGSKDKLSRQKDVKWLQNKLINSNLKRILKINSDHYGFICGQDMIFVNEVIKFIQQ